MRRRSRKRTARVFLAGLLAITACTTPRPAPAPLPSAAEAPVPVPAMRVALPETPARSGVVYRLGLKSDLTDLSIGSAGTLWIVTSGDRAGPIARGDTVTVLGHLDAAHRVSEEVGRQFRLIAEATAIRSGRSVERS